MEKQNRVLMWLVVLVPLLGAVLAIIPPQEKLKGGIDLAGGFSLLYEIDTTGMKPSEIRERGGLANRVKDILQKRVDPNAQLNLIWRPVGTTRLEVQMPRPPRDAIERRQRYEEALREIRSRNIGRLEVESALSADPDVRGTRLGELHRAVLGREKKLAALQEAYDAYRQVQGGDDLDAEDAAQSAYEDAFDIVLATSLAPDRLEDVLALPDHKEQAEQLGRLKTEYPSYTELIEEVEARHEEWTADKAALEDPADLKRLLRGAGVLEFRILADRDASNPSMIASTEAGLRQPTAKYAEQLQQYGPRPKAGDRYRWFPLADVRSFLYLDSMDQIEEVSRTGQQIVEKYAGRWYVLSHADQRYGLLRDAERKWRLKSAIQRFDNNGRPCVNFTLDARGGSIFRRMTRENKQRQLCIMLDDEAMSHATIQSEIAQQGQITGSTFTTEKVQRLVQTLEAGSLPGRLKDTPLMEKNVGPSLGRTNRVLGMNAAIYGMIAVAVLVLVYYLAAGVVANIALALNLLFVLGIMATLEATFTLPGIAGLILTVGMAVDANVLIFERVREERARGTVFKRALKTGYDKALSTIIDANLTTLITCVVLGYLGSEEVKGFAMTLGFGICTSMFTALFVTRLIFITLMDFGWLKDLKMLKLIGQPKIDWLALRTKFWPISLVLVLGGVGWFAYASVTDADKVYDIEFLGGTSVQIELAEGVELNDEDVRRRVTSSDPDGPASAVIWLRQAADALEQAKVSEGDSRTQFVLTSSALTSGQIAALMQTKRRGATDALVDQLESGGLVAEGHTCRFYVKPEAGMDLGKFNAAVTAAVEYARRAADLMRGARIQTVRDVDQEGGTAEAEAFEIITVETNKDLVKEAVLAAMGDNLAVERPISFVHLTDPAHPEGYYPIDEEARYLSDVIGGEANFDVRRYKGGVVLLFDQLDPPQPVAEVEKRIKEIRLQPGFEQYKWRDYGIFGLTSAGGAGSDERFTKIALAVVDEDLPYYADVERWREDVAKPEMEQATQALQTEKTLRKVIQFAPQVADQTKNQTILAIAIALAAIVGYVWIRFGSMQFGLAAIVALVHDVSITLGFITLSDFFHGGALGDFLLIQAFKIDLPMIAAMLTIIGYSLNDTIVVFDRIRENRGKLTTLSPQMINTSINQTLSRTLLTSLTTFVVVSVMYVFGGQGVHGFAYALMLGVIVGTYSSVGVATPLLYRPRLLHIIVYILIALGIVGATAVMSGDATWTAVIGLIVAVVLAAVIVLEVRSERDYGGLAASSA